MIVYFTGTGNSRYCAQMLADKLGDELIDAFHFIRDGIAAELISEKPWVFVAPTYGWQLPHIFMDFIRRGSFEGSKDAYFVMTCGGDIGNASRKSRALCTEKGLRYHGTMEVVMPENYIALFDAPKEAEAQKIIAAALPALDRGIACIREKRDFQEVKADISGKLKSGIVNTVFYRFVIKAKPFTVSDRCIGCSKCERACPLGNIQLKGGKPVWGNRCTHCMACICGCPTEAIEYGKASVWESPDISARNTKRSESVVRKFQACNIERVLKLWLEGNMDAHDFVPKDYWASNASLVRKLLLQAELYVYELDRDIRGFAGMQNDYLAGIFVDKKYRSMGIGKQLLDHIKKFYPSFSLNVYRKNKRAVDFYVREGFLLVSESMDENTGEVDYTMAWKENGAAKENARNLLKNPENLPNNENNRDIGDWGADYHQICA